MLTKVGNQLFWNQISGKESQLALPFLAAICNISIKKRLLGTELPVCSVVLTSQGPESLVSAQMCFGSSGESDKGDVVEE